MGADLDARFAALWTTHCAPRVTPGTDVAATLLPTAPMAPAAAATDGAVVTAELPRLSIRVGDDDGATTEGDDAPGEWVLGALLGAGGMGKVYAGVQRSLRRTVALKVATADRAHLLREARITGRLEHPNIVPVHVLGVDDQGDPVMVMKRIEGVSWRSLVEDPTHAAWAPLDERHRDRVEAHVHVLLQVCDALSFAHAQGVIHRDVKPANVMLGSFGEVYLVDWGVALDRAAPPRESLVVGTPSYMAPEMLYGDPARITPATDVYLLGASLHEALTGAAPHQGDSVRAVLAAAFESEPPVFNDDVPAALAALCRDAMHREVPRRVPDVATFRARLVDWQRHRGSVALSDAARRALDALPEDDVLATPDAWAGMAACRFGFQRALKAWPENLDARAGLRRVLARVVSRELARRNLAAARAALAEMTDAPAELAARVDALAADLTETRAREARAEAARREMDLSPWTRQRPWLFAGLTGAIALLGSALLAAPGVDATRGSYPQVLAGDAAFVVIALVPMVALRRRILANRMTRRFTSVVALTMASTIAVDVVAWRCGFELVVGSVHRLLALSAVVFVAALLGMPGLALPGVLSLLGAALILAAPTKVFGLMPVILGVVTVTVGWIVRSGRLRAGAPELNPRG